MTSESLSYSKGLQFFFQWKAAERHLPTVKDYNCISGKEGVAEKRTTVLDKPSPDKWSSKTRNLINKQQPTINPKPQRKVKWKTAHCRPRASEQSSGGEDKFRYHTESLWTQSWLQSLQANCSWLQRAVCLSRCMCGHVWLCQTVWLFLYMFSCVYMWCLILSQCSFIVSVLGDNIYTFQPGEVQVCVCVCVYVRPYVCTTLSVSLRICVSL